MTATATLDKNSLAKASTIARGLAIDAVHAAGIGHLGMPLGCAEMGGVLYGHALRIDPRHPRWMNRDRLVLSAGHGSMFLYAWLHLCGFDLPMEQIKRFRQLHSHTAGHPEFNEAPGVEATTGPLGQGTGNAVGMAMAGKMAAARFNRPGQTIFDYHVVCIAGDGCMQEGVSSEASALAGHLGLDNLIFIYDANDVTLDAAGPETQSEDTAKRYEAYGWDVVTVDGHDMDGFLAAFNAARENDNGKPKLIIARTEIGRGIPEVAGTWKAHGESGHTYADTARKGLGLPDETFYVSDEVRAYFDGHQERLHSHYDQWAKTYEEWKQAHPDEARLLENGFDKVVPDPETLLAAVPEFGDDAVDATRGFGGKALNAIAAELPLLLSGSADLHGSTKNYMKGLGDFKRGEYQGRNFRFGIREHAMGAIQNGFAYDGLFLTSGATFTTFSDYMRPAIRLAALSRVHTFYIFTHDSVGVGEDGPTHQPVEHTSALRLIPHLDVIRPADGEETAAAFVAAATRTDGPTALILSRQKVPNLAAIPVKTRREGVLRGGYVAVEEKGALRLILLGTGSELQLAVEAATRLGEGVRVVSMPCFERFERQDEDYRLSVLPDSCRARVAVEAGVPGLWRMYVGFEGAVVGINRFGLSAPGDEVMAEMGMTVENVVAHAKKVLG